MICQLHSAPIVPEALLLSYLLGALPSMSIEVWVEVAVLGVITVVTPLDVQIAKTPLDPCIRPPRCVVCSATSHLAVPLRVRTVVASHVIVRIPWCMDYPPPLIAAVEEACYGQRWDRLRQEVEKQEFPLYESRDILDDLE